MSYPFPATEIASIALKPGTDLTTIETAKHLDEALRTIASQPGNKVIYYGPTLEDPEQFDLVIEWEKMDDHINFTKAPEYKPFIDGLKGSMMSAITGMQHVRHPYAEGFTKASSAPITEILTVYFPADVDKADFEARVKKFEEILFADSDAAVAIAGGWVVEELEYEGQKGPVFAAALGWKSLEAHKEFAATQTFKDSVPVLMEGARGRVLHHTKFTKYEG